MVVDGEVCSIAKSVKTALPIWPSVFVNAALHRPSLFPSFRQRFLICMKVGNPFDTFPDWLESSSNCMLIRHPSFTTGTCSSVMSPLFNFVSRVPSVALRHPSTVHLRDFHIFADR